MTEIWKPIPSAPGWEASSNGRLRALLHVKMPNGGIKNLHVLPTHGVFCKKKRRFKQSVMNRTRWVAPLVCEAFHGARPPGKTDCMHLDEDSSNDMPSNLAWGTHSENHNAPKFLQRTRERMLQHWAERRREAKCQEHN